MDSKLKVVLVLVAVAVVLVGLQVGLAVLQDEPEAGTRRTAETEELSGDAVMQGLAGLLAPLAASVERGRLDGCGLADDRFDLDGSCTLRIRASDTRFAKLDLHVRRGSAEVRYRPALEDADFSDWEPVREDESTLVPIMEDGGVMELRCPEAPCRLEVR